MRKFKIYWPWTRLAAQARTIDYYQAQNRRMEQRIEAGTAENKRLAREINDLRRQHANVPGSFDRYGAAKPEFVIIGLDAGPGMCDGVRVDGRKRIMVSRDLTAASLGMTPLDNPPPRWSISAVMAKMLVIDKTSYGEALDRMAEIWANQDRDHRRAIEGEWKAIEQ